MADTLLGALLNIQEKAPKVQKEGINPFTESKYMQLDDVVNAVTPMLTEEGLLWQARPSIDADGRPVLKYSLTHVATKEAIEDHMHLMLLKGAPQDQGSAITYARRYALVCVLNLVTDRDDDGHAATQTARANGQTPGGRLPAPEPQRASETQAALTEEEQAALRRLVAEHTAALKKDYSEEWDKVVEWAKERSIDLATPPADKLRAVERALSRKLETSRAKAAQAEAQAAKKKAPSKDKPGEKADAGKS